MNGHTETFKSLGDISPISSSFSKINIKLNECMHAQINECKKIKRCNAVTDKFYDASKVTLPFYL